MSKRAALPKSVTEPQNSASDPDISAWVAANAGSGKTHVLMLRVIKLLLRGTNPSKILCITFTKAAAANMAMRVFGELAKWTAYSDTQLDEAITKIGFEADAKIRARARQLFATALETPGGLKVQTIHAFCTRILHQFPFEADVAASFSVLDEATEHQMLDELTLKVMLEAASQPESTLGRALDTVLATAADQTFRDVIREAIRKRDEVEQWVTQAGGVDAAIAELSRSLGIAPTDTVESIDDELLSAALILESDWPGYMSAFSQGSPKDQDQRDRFEALIAARREHRLEKYLDIFCTKERTARASLMTKVLAKEYPAHAQNLQEEQGRVCALLNKKRAAECRDRTATLITIAYAVIALYRAEKDRRGLLDYADLIDKTLELFSRTSAAWVLYKLDAGIEHVLIDEAQDTSPKQWAIIGTIISEFTAGKGARTEKRTLFTVGDDKQSIFSFQGARPELFDVKFREYRDAFAAAKLELKKERLQTSFRSGEIILNAVDRVFADKSVYESLTSDEVGIPEHKALDGAVPGFVEIWPTTRPSERREKLAWDAPFDAESETSPRVELARRIARNVRRWIDHETIGQDKNPVAAKDILILVRQRGPLFEAIIRALKDQHVPVAGADRLVLTEHIAIMDLMALADALLLPQDDLALACVLKSPLFGLSEDDLYEIAWNRGQLSLREALRQNRKYSAVATQIDALASDARRESPFAFYAKLLGPLGGRRRIFERLGHEAADALDEFLSLALTYESREASSLQGFVAWLRASEVEVKRDMEMTRDEVRVMTVHGAKGLEAPIVVLADTTTPPAGPSGRQPRLILLPPTRAVPGAPHQLVWAGAKDNDVGPMADARESAKNAAANEYRRLLYVAMTRAAERLIICGADGATKRPEGCWYDLVNEGLKEHLVQVPASDGEGDVHRYQKSGEESSAKRTTAQKAKPDALPAWLNNPFTPDPPRGAVITPSADDEISVHAGGGVFEREKARARGRIVHRLMQSLPDIPEAHRAEAARRYVSRAAGEFSETERSEIATQARAILNDKIFAPLFTASSRAEVPIVGRLACVRQPDILVSGQIDRLAITDDAVLIADYKTNRPAPRDIAELLARHGGYVRQLALYRAVLATVYPDRKIRAALVWTEIPALMEIPVALLDERIAKITGS